MNTDLMIDQLQADGFKPSLDSDGDIRMKFQGGTYWITVDKDDAPYVRLVYPNFWTVTANNDHEQILGICNKLSIDYKFVKVYLLDFEDGTRGVCASIELMLPDEAAFAQFYQRALQILSATAGDFGSLARNARTSKETAEAVA